MIKHTYPLFTLLLLGLIACQPPTPPDSLTGQWELLAYEDRSTLARSYAPEHLPAPVIADFSDRFNRGNYHIETATNSMWGKYRISKDQTVEFLELDGTLRGENQWAKQLWSALETSHDYVYSPDWDTLYINFQENQQSMVWLRR
ncbi:MAG: hypothetical protein AAF804_04590 [Bacteroidota bacterium]